MLIAGHFAAEKGISAAREWLRGSDTRIAA